MATKEIVNDFLRRRLQNTRTVIPESCLLVTQQPNTEITSALWTLCREFKNQFLDSFESMLSELKFTHDQKVSEEEFYTVASELFSKGVQWSHIVALFVFSGELAASYGDRLWVDLLDPLSEWLTRYIENHLVSWIEEHGHWMGIVEYEKGRRDLAFGEDPWPRLKNLVCGLTAGVIGIFALKAIFSR